MRPREEVKAGLVGRWVHKAEVDIGVAEHLLEEGSVFPSVIAFHCQKKLVPRWYSRNESATQFCRGFRPGRSSPPQAGQ